MVRGLSRPAEEYRDRLRHVCCDSVVLLYQDVTDNYLVIEHLEIRRFCDLKQPRVEREDTERFASV
jgi:hypothetical protein